MHTTLSCFCHARHKKHFWCSVLVERVVYSHRYHIPWDPGAPPKVSRPTWLILSITGGGSWSEWHRNKKKQNKTPNTRAFGSRITFVSVKSSVKNSKFTDSYRLGEIYVRHLAVSFPCNSYHLTCNDTKIQLNQLMPFAALNFLLDFWFCVRLRCTNNLTNCQELHY